MGEEGWWAGGDGLRGKDEIRVKSAFCEKTGEKILRTSGEEPQDREWGEHAGGGAKSEKDAEGRGPSVRP